MVGDDNHMVPRVQNGFPFGENHFILADNNAEHGSFFHAGADFLDFHAGYFAGFFDGEADRFDIDIGEFHDGVDIAPGDYFQDFPGGREAGVDDMIDPYRFIQFVMSHIGGSGDHFVSPFGFRQQRRKHVIIGGIGNGDKKRGFVDIKFAQEIIIGAVTVKDLDIIKPGGGFMGMFQRGIDIGDVVIFEFVGAVVGSYH